MKRLLLTVIFAAFASIAGGALAEVGVSVSIGQPGFYGRLDIGSYPPPVLIYAQPLIIERVRPGIVYAPIYLRVPPGHSRHWGKHCHRYRACGRPVYFVQDSWYNDVYAPRYHELHGRPKHRHDRRDHFDRNGPGHPPGQLPRHGPRDDVDFPQGPRRGHSPDYLPGPGPGFGPGHLPGRP